MRPTSSSILAYQLRRRANHKSADEYGSEVTGDDVVRFHLGMEALLDSGLLVIRTLIAAEQVFRRCKPSSPSGSQPLVVWALGLQTRCSAASLPRRGHELALATLDSRTPAGVTRALTAVRTAPYDRQFMDDLRRPILVNSYERAVDDKLAALCELYDARLFAKVGVKDVLPVSRGRLDQADFSYALKAHFDFVVADADDRALLAVEFDGPRHRTDPRAVERDLRKNRLCRDHLLPLLRVGAPALRPADHRTLLEWIVQVWFEHHRLVETRNAMHDDDDWDGDPPEHDPDDFDYRTAFALRERGMRTVAPLDAFEDARERLGRFIWSQLGRPELKGWYGRHPRGHDVGVLALEVEPRAWLVGRGSADLQGVWPWLDGVSPAIVSQDLALLQLAGQTDEWERGRLRAVSAEVLTSLTQGLTRGELTWAAIPTQHELFQFTLQHMRRRGVDVDEPGMFTRLYMSFMDGDDERRCRFDEDW
jgi:hypothetical protein